MNRRTVTMALCLAIVLVMALLARQEVGSPTQAPLNTPGVVQVTAYVPFHVLDSTGASLACISNTGGRTLPPLMVLGTATVAPVGGVYIAPGAMSSTSTTYAPAGGN